MLLPLLPESEELSLLPPEELPELPLEELPPEEPLPESEDPMELLPESGSLPSAGFASVLTSVLVSVSGLLSATLLGRAFSCWAASQGW